MYEESIEVALVGLFFLLGVGHKTLLHFFLGAKDNAARLYSYEMVHGELMRMIQSPLDGKEVFTTPVNSRSTQ